MASQKIVSVYFSPNGTTQTVVKWIAQSVCAGGEAFETVDLLREVPVQSRRFDSDTLVVVGMPVYAGRIPTHCRELLEALSANGARAIAAVAYGNRDYDDALLELCDLLTSQGFSLIGAGAFVAEHCIFPKVAAKRPDRKDLEEIARFAKRCRTLLNSGAQGALHVKGNPDYRAVGSVPLKPSGDERCTDCKRCAAICPMHAIDPEKPRETDASRCISCGACIHLCPAKARGYHGIPYQVAAKGFALKCAARREPEVFYPEGNLG